MNLQVSAQKLKNKRNIFQVEHLFSLLGNEIGWRNFILINSTLERTKWTIVRKSTQKLSENVLVFT